MNDYARIERALALIEREATSQPRLDDLAAAAGLSPFHFQRLFTRWAGVSPKRFLQAVTVARARTLLREGRAVLDVALDVGLSGPGRLHDLTVTCEAMTPGEIARHGEGVRVRHATVESPFGTAFVAFTERGLCAVEFLDAASEAPPRLFARWKGARFEPGSPEQAQAWSDRIFGETSAEPPRLHLRGTNFQLQVWRALLRIPEGGLVDYGAVAAHVGRPGASRAVGQAVGANPVAVVIPCHRVLRKHGELGGYRWGTTRKLALLGRELARADAAAAEAQSSSG